VIGDYAMKTTLKVLTLFFCLSISPVQAATPYIGIAGINSDNSLIDPMATVVLGIDVTKGSLLLAPSITIGDDYRAATISLGWDFGPIQVTIGGSQTYLSVVSQKETAVDDFSTQIVDFNFSDTFDSKILSIKYGVIFLAYSQGDASDTTTVNTVSTNPVPTLIPHTQRFNEDIDLIQAGIKFDF
jgi:hypothetical protein